MSRSVHVPAGIFDSRQYGFAQVAIVTTPFGSAVHVSGQVAWDADQNIVGAGDIGRQLEKSLENLAVALESVGARLDQVGALRLYIKISSKATWTKARPSAAPSRRCSATSRRVRPGLGCQASPTMNSWSKWSPRRFSSRRRTASQRLAPLTNAACAGRARAPTPAPPSSARSRSPAPAPNDGRSCASLRSTARRCWSP